LKRGSSGDFSMKPMKSLFQYFDYQEFFRDFYEQKKRESPYMSYRYLGGKLGLDPGFLLKVMQGKLHLSEKSIPQLCSFFNFAERESSYFEILVRYNKAKSPSDIKLYFEKLIATRDSRARPVQESQYAFYQKWYHGAIHALLSIYEFTGNFKELSSLLSPSITAAEARDSIRLLMRLKMVKKDASGVFRPIDAMVTSGEKWQAAAIRDFQKESILLSAQSLDQHPKEERDVSTVTITLNEKELPEIRERIRQLRQSILSLDEDVVPDRVYQLNIQLFPVTRRTGGAE
jgi:uncharacterized protein (TIGR02147 family)